MTDKAAKKNKIAAAIGLLGGWSWVATRFLSRIAARGILAFLRATGKLILTIWRLAAALDSALWRATKLLARRAARGAFYIFGILAAAIRGLLLWLPTRWGRAYSAISGAFLVVASLWIVDELRAGTELAAASATTLRPPIDEDDPILARIEGRYVHLSEIEASARASGFLRPGERLTPQSAYSRALVESYVEQRLLARAALDDGLHRTPTVLRRVNAARDRVLAATFLDQHIEDAVTPENVERLYDAQVDVTALGDEVRARHIVVATEEEATEISTLLDGGADFGALARERSIDRATSGLSGEVGWFTRAMMAPAFSRAAFSTSAGQRAAPFATEFGWHILEVMDRRPTQAVPLSEVRSGIEDFLRLRTIDKLVRELEEDNQVIYYRPETTAIDDPMAPPEIPALPLREGDDQPVQTPL